jgi:acid phosphatase type 7
MSALRILLVSSLLLASCDAFAQSVFRGPYLNDVTSDAVTVVWESPSPSRATIRYGASSLNERSVSVNTPDTHHEVRLTGLDALVPPGGEIRYEVQVQSQRYSGRFHTAPTGRAPFSFLVYGDNRSSPDQHQVVVDALLREGPVSFAMNTGDLVASGEAEADWDLFFPVATPFLSNTPLFVAIGNHEVALRRWDVTKRLFVMPTATPPASNNEGYYHVIHGNVELIVVNVEVDSLYTLRLLSGDQEDWLEQVLAQRPAGVDHRFLFLHQGPYSSKPGRNGNFWLRQWLDRLKSADVDVIFSGHDHYAERGFAKNGMYYVIHGGGGAPLYNTLGPRTTSDHTIVYGETRLGFARVDINGPKAVVTIKGIANEILDQFTYGDAAAPECRQPSDCGPPPTFGCPNGAWSCERSACHFACPSAAGDLIVCATDSACESAIGATCAGTPSCEHPSVNPLSWYCACNVPPDCTQSSDCANRPSPLPGCTGTWSCADEQCEFSSDLCMPMGMDGGADAGEGGDSGSGQGPVAMDASTMEPDAGLSPVEKAEAGVPLTGEAPDDQVPLASAGAPDGGASSSTRSPGTPGAAPDAGGCGCTETNGRSSAGAFALIGAMAAMGHVTRRRRRASVAE